MHVNNWKSTHYYSFLHSLLLFLHNYSFIIFTHSHPHFSTDLSQWSANFGAERTSLSSTNCKSLETSFKNPSRLKSIQPRHGFYDGWSSAWNFSFQTVFLMWAPGWALSYKRQLSSLIYVNPWLQLFVVHHSIFQRILWCLLSGS